MKLKSPSKTGANHVLNPVERSKKTAKAQQTESSSDFGPCLSPASFWRPHFLESSAWIEHSPFAFWITSVLKPRSIVELGTHSGFSYFAFCQAVQTAGLETRCFAVDTWKGDEHAGLYGEDVFESVNSYNNQHYSTFSRLVRSTFAEALLHFSDSSIDMLHLDGRHYYEDVRNDFESWRPKLSERAVVLIHDTNVRERGFGVFQFWAELASEFPHFEFFHCNGLGVLGHGVDLPEEVLSLCKSSGDRNSAIAIRTLYSCLGGAIQSDFDANIARSRLKNSAAVVGGLRMDLENGKDEITKLGNEWKVLNDENAKLRWELERSYNGAAKLGNEWKILNDDNANVRRELERSNSEAVKLGNQCKILNDDNANVRRELERSNSEAVKLGNECKTLNDENAKARRELERSNSETAKLQAELEARNVETTALVRESEARYSRLASEHAAMKSRSESLEVDLVAHHQQLVALEGRMAARARELAIAVKMLSHRDSEKLALTKDVAAAQTKIAEFEYANADLASRIEDVGARLGELETAMVQLKAERTDLLQENRSLELQLSARSQALAEAIKQVQALYASSSWKLTRPLRVLKRGAMRLRGTGSKALEGVASPTSAIEASAEPQKTLPTKVERPVDRLDKMPSTESVSEGEPAISRAIQIESLPGLEGIAPSDIERISTTFDRTYYLAMNPDVRASGDDPFEHYMSVGWKEGRDPCPDFCTIFYLLQAVDLAAANINPFVHWVLHGIQENRPALSFRRRLERKEFALKVSAIVPNFNHAPFLTQRIETILAQTYTNLEILVLDDCSSDGSRSIIDRYCEEYPSRIRKLINGRNSGNVFSQWRKGIENTDGEIVWICESDDFCEPDFLEKLVPYFKDDSINLAFGRIQKTDREGNFLEVLDQYREGAEPGIWQHALVRPARQWFAKGFGVNNVIANVGGSLWRRAKIPEAIWREAQTYSVVGDWFLYCSIANGGQIAWEPEAVSYFRQHGTNTSAASFIGPTFYKELERLMLNLRSQWNVPDETVEKFYTKVAEQYAWFGLVEKYGALENYCDKRKLLAQGRTRPHVLITFYGFIAGGGEVFPLNLANHLHLNGWRVSMLSFEMTNVNPDMRAALDPAIPVYDSDWVVEYGADRFLAEAGISIVHSHTVGSEYNFFERWQIKTKVPYLVTLHGSYEASEHAEERTARIVQGVSHFVFTANKNLEPLRFLALPDSMFTKLPNAMPLDPLPFPKSREDLGIESDAVVFTLVARGIPTKGWRTSVAAFLRLRKQHPERPMHLLLCGDGEVPDQLFATHGGDPDITFLGYQSRIHGLYRISDVAIVPSRFSGESFPLCVIQALQTGTPLIASRVGEIETMLAPPHQKSAGLLIEPAADNELFIQSLVQAMELMLSPTCRNEYAAAARILGESYSMDKLVSVYGSLYESMLSKHEPPPILESVNSTFSKKSRTARSRGVSIVME
jgi:glycosyltransferase involved in cell wall biosynthesis/septal ring factor EnvC (AmiA/AmiB activator)